MTIEERLDRLGPAICPRCRKPAYIFVGRYNLICRSCERSLRDADGGQTPRTTQEGMVNG